MFDQHVEPADSFDAAFCALTGYAPFPWQRALYRRFISDRPDNIPSSCSLPTGLGKTAVIPIWLLALAAAPTKLPRRLVYVVNRRTVVDQSTREAEKVRDGIVKIPEVDKVLRRMCAVTPQPAEPPLAISTLRGQFADNREWSADPARPAVIVGTVDMIGSRLLFGGYGVGFKSKPLHAGFLGQDSLIVHDEAHLEPAFQDLLLDVQKEQRRGRFPDRSPLRVMELSATSRRTGEDLNAASPFTFTSADYGHDEVKRRIHATKELTLLPQGDAKLGEQLAKLAIDRFKASGDAVLMFARMIDDVKQIADRLAKDKLPNAQLTGTIRGLEREKLLDSPIFKRFLSRAGGGGETVYLICTSAGEVGVNISADHLVCDLTTFESMAQRFGRVNRFGLRDDTCIHVVHPDTFDEKDRLTPARRRTLDLLRQLNGNASPEALGNLDAKARADAFAPLPTILPASDILFDAWSMTTIRGKLPGRPPVEPYLHGIREYEPPETHVAWREEVGVIVGDLLEEYPPRELLEAYPVKPHELLRDRTDRVWKEMAKLAARHPQKPVWIVDDEGDVEVVPHLSELAARQKRDAETRIAQKTVLLPHDIGGLTDQGTLNGDVPPLPKKGEVAVATNHDVADRWSDGRGPMRERRWTTLKADSPDGDPPAEDQAPPPRMKPVHQVVLTDAADEEGEPIARWHWFARVLEADPDARSRQPYELDRHLKDAGEAARRFVSGLSLDPALRDAVVLAAQFHDLGKHRERWQRGIGNADYPRDVWAKSGKRRGRIERSPYRHEFGSVLDILKRPEF